jgi:D-sedoheptulose 7-phosphate isomerase
MPDFLHPRIQTLIERYPALSACAASIQQAHDLMVASYRAGGKLLLCGNGGSAADADHISGELLKGFGHSRPLGPEDRDRLGPALAGKLQGALPAIPLPLFAALGTAFGNDCDGDYAYAQLVHGLGKPGDVLFGISTSGNARNVLLAVDVARKSGLKTIGLTGARGGHLAQAVDCAIQAPEDETYRIQEYHLPIYHCFCLMLEDSFFPFN